MKLLIAGGILGAMLGAAQAADLPVKAPKAFLGNTYPTTSGFYFGLGAAGASTSVQATGLPGVNTAGLNSFGGSIYGTLGYVWTSSDGGRFVRANLDAGWQNINGQNAGFSFSGPASVQAAVQVGVPFTQIAAFLPNLGLPNFPGLPALPPAPAGVTYGPPHMYAGLMADINDVSFNFGAAQNTVWHVAPGIQLGMLVPTSNGMMIDPRVEIAWNNQGTCLGGGVMCAKEGTTYRFKLGVQF